MWYGKKVYVPSERSDRFYAVIRRIAGRFEVESVSVQECEVCDNLSDGSGGMSERLIV